MLTYLELHFLVAIKIKACYNIDIPNWLTKKEGRAVNNRLKEFREKRGVTKSHLSRLILTSLSGYERIEKGEATLGIYKAQILAEELDVHVIDLFPLDKEKFYEAQNKKARSQK